MNLDNFTSFKQLDPQNMLGEIDNLPGQLQSAWDLGQRQPLPDGQGITRVIISGMGGSAIGADLLAAYIVPLCKLPVVVYRAWPGDAGHRLVSLRQYRGDARGFRSSH